MKHWAYHLIGKPYQAGASGPDSFDCIGLVRYYFKLRHGLDLPDYQVGNDTADLLRFTRATGWRRAGADRQDEDLVTMTGLAGRHIGVTVATDEGLGLLHAIGNNRLGQVVWQPFETLVGYRNLETWRRACI